MEAECRGIFAMCTGSGKSYTALACMVALVRQKQEQLAVFIVCPQIHLVGQWEEDEDQLGAFSDHCTFTIQNRHWKEDLVRLYKRFRNYGEPFVCITTNDTFSGEAIQQIVTRLKKEQNVLLYYR